MTLNQVVLAPKRRRDTAGVDGVCGSLAVAALMCGRSGKVALAVPQVNFLNSLRARVMARVRKFLPTRTVREISLAHNSFLRRDFLEARMF